MSRVVTLAENEILVNGQKYILIDGYKEWSYQEYQVSPRIRHVTVCYKQHAIVFLRKQKNGFVERHGEKKTYKTLGEVVEAFQESWSVTFEDKQLHGRNLVQWCQRGPTVATVTVILNREDYERFTALASRRDCDLETLATRLVQAALAEEAPLIATI